MTNLTIFNGDNFKFLENNTVDFVLTDPPFNISKKSNFHTYEKNTIHSYQFDGDSDESWDTYTHEEFLKKLDEWSYEWGRVLKKGGNFAIFCADMYISHLMEALKKNGLTPRRVFTWRKNNAVPVNRAYIPMSANEYVIVGVKEGKKSTFNANIPIVEQKIDEQKIEAVVVADKVSTIVYTKIREMVNSLPPHVTEEEHLDAVAGVVESVLEDVKKLSVKKTLAMYKEDSEGKKYLQACIPNYVQNPLKVGNRIHPTEKPVPLLQYFVSLYSKPGDVVLDSFGGSGSTGEAALTLGRDVIVVEREKDFYDKLHDRLKVQADLITIIQD